MSAYVGNGLFCKRSDRRVGIKSFAARVVFLVVRVMFWRGSSIVVGTVVEFSNFGAGFRPRAGRVAGVSEPKAGLQFDQWCTSVRSFPSADLPTRRRKHEFPSLSTMGKGPWYGAPNGVGLPFAK